MSNDPEDPQAKIERLERELAQLKASRQIQGDAVAGDSVTRDKINSQVNTATAVIVEKGATIVYGEQPIKITALDAESARGKYLAYLIGQNRYLQLQGIRSGGKLVNIELDRIYITLRATRERVAIASGEDDWLKHEMAFAPGEMHRKRGSGSNESPIQETTTVSVNEALAEHKRLAVLGDPGSGKTTLLRYLALLYARDQAENRHDVQTRLNLNESGYLPLLLQLRQIGAFLKNRKPESDGTEGHALLIEFLLQSLKNERIALPSDFFDEWLNSGRAVILLDGMDEVADPALRHRVARLIESFTRAYGDCRYVVTSRIVGYACAARLSETYTTTTVRDFTNADIREFLTQWHRLLALGELGPGDPAEQRAADLTQQLLQSIEAKERVRELAINPLMLTVIAMIHRDRVKLPDRRAELYAEAVEVLLDKWDTAKGAQMELLVNGQPLDLGTKRLALQSVTLAMHVQQIKEIDADSLKALLAKDLRISASDPRDVEQTLKPFLKLIEERTGLLVARAESTYAFSHLTFQEYLAALAIADRADYIVYALERMPNEWWREVILLLAGHLSSGGKQRTTALIRAIADKKEEPELYHNLVLAAECLRDAGENRVEGQLGNDLRGRLQREADAAIDRGRLAGLKTIFTRGMTTKQAVQRKVAAAEALGKLGGHQYWRLPYGEPEWVTVLAGEFWMGSREGVGFDTEKPLHKVALPEYHIAKVPTTNAQYALFVQAAQHPAPRHWEDGRIPKGKDNHPVVNVTWHDALAYCRWLASVTGKPITLPSEAEFEKAARGDQDQREWPWGDVFESSRCNSWESGLEQTTPVGIFASGASPYGCLDMVGNVWEWTRSLWGPKKSKEKDNYDYVLKYRYPYVFDDGRENIEADDTWARVLRGGSWDDVQHSARCASRLGSLPGYYWDELGFRVAMSPFFLKPL